MESNEESYTGETFDPDIKQFSLKNTDRSSPEETEDNNTNRSNQVETVDPGRVDTPEVIDDGASGDASEEEIFAGSDLFAPDGSYDSDASFSCWSDGYDSDNDDSDDSPDETGERGRGQRGQTRSGVKDTIRADGESSGDEGEYDLDLAEELSDSSDDDEIDGTTCDVTQVFPWKDAGVVDLETASKWDFTTLTKNCKWAVAKETIERVSSFVARLRKIEEFRAKIRLDPHIPDEDMAKIFLNLDEVLKLQLAVLGDFRKELLKRPFKPRVGKVLRRLAPFLKLHEDLACKSTLCRSAIQTLSDKNQAFRSAHDRFKRTGYRLDLGDLLCEPYKYIVDLKEQLRKYLKCVNYPEDHDNTVDALTKVENVLRVIDENSMVYHESNVRLLEIRPIFKRKNIEIVKPHRTFKFEAKMSLISPQTGLPHSCEVFLFSDICVLCTPCLAESRSSSVRILNLRRTLVTQEEDNVIVIYSPDKVIELQTTESNARKLFETMTTVTDPPVYDVKNGVVIFDAPLGTRAPRFVPGRKVKSCATCQKKFSRRRRGACHCHACGKVVCVSCCRHSAVLPYRAQDIPRRVCDRCWRHLGVQAS